MRSDIFSVSLLLSLPLALSACHVSRPAAVVTEAPAPAPGSFGHLKELVANDDYEGLAEQYCGKSLLVKGDLDLMGTLKLTDRKMMAEALRLFFSEPDIISRDRTLIAVDRRKELRKYHSFEDLEAVARSGTERLFSLITVTKNDHDEIEIPHLYLGVEEFDDLARFEPKKSTRR